MTFMSLWRKIMIDVYLDQADSQLQYHRNRQGKISNPLDKVGKICL